MSTHSSNVIDYERLLSRAGTTTFTMSIMVHDGKQLVKENLIIDVTDVNEAPRFIQPAIGASAVEVSLFGTKYIGVLGYFEF